MVIAFDFLGLTRYLIFVGALPQLLCFALAIMLPFAAKGEQSDIYPKTVTLKTDVALPVPFAVVDSMVPAKAGMEVTVKSVHGDRLKVAYGVGEGLVPIADTDFAARLPQAQKDAEEARQKAQEAERARASREATTQPPQESNPFDAVTMPATARNRQSGASATPPVSVEAAESMAHKINVLTGEFTESIVLPTDFPDAVIVASLKILPTLEIAKRWHMVAACVVGQHFNENPGVSVKEIWFSDRSAMSENPPRYRVLPLTVATTLQAQFKADQIGDISEGESRIWNNLQERAVPRN